MHDLGHLHRRYIHRPQHIRVFPLLMAERRRRLLRRIVGGAMYLVAIGAFFAIAKVMGWL